MSTTDDSAEDIAHRARIRQLQIEKAESEAQLAKLEVAERAMKVKVRSDTEKRIQEANDLTRDA